MSLAFYFGFAIVAELMPLINIIIIAVGLAMDALAVSIATGVSLKRVNVRQTFRLAWHFGFFQAMMPVIGWFAGLTVRSLIEHYDHWIAFILLALVGGRMIREAFQEDTSPDKKIDPTRGWTLVLLSVATSIDALAVGLSLSMLKISIWTPALIIGLVAGGFTMAGLRLGERMGSAARLGRYAEILGGMVLLIIGVKILYEHDALSFLR